MRNLTRNMLVFILLGSVILHSCSLTKHLPENEMLYAGTRKVMYEKVGDDKQDWKINDFAEKSTDVIMTLWVSPNGGLLGAPYMIFFPLRLYFYNWFHTEKEKGFSHWMMENFGEPPISISAVNPEMRARSIENSLFNMGHFGAEVNYEVEERRNRKAIIKYTIKIPRAYSYDSVGIIMDSSQQVLAPEFEEYMKNSKITPGEDFNLDDLADEKKLLSEHLQNKGYYYINEDHILLLADTTAGNRQVNLQYRLDRTLSSTQMKKAYIEDKTLVIDTSKINFSGGKAFSGRGVEVNERLMDKVIEINKDSIYSLEAQRKTLRNASSVGMFTEPAITYEQKNQDSTRLEAKIDLKTVNMFTLGLNGNIIQKNTGLVGPGLEVFATQRNLWGSAEILNVALDGYLDFPYGVLSEFSSRSSGFSTTASISAPILRSPFKFITNNAILLPRRSISLSFGMNNRDEYFTFAEWKGTYGLTWFTRPKISHELNIINANYLNLLSTTLAFDTLLDQSQVIENSFSSKFITGPSYTFTYNNTAGEFRRFRSYYQASVELAGNLLEGANRLAGNSERDKKFLGVEYSQFIRFTSDFRAYFMVGNRGSNLAFRSYLGIGKPYGNSNNMPYTKQFYIGGSNSLRPITARVLGPGRYVEFDERAINQVGDIKIETNLEYRFRIAYIVHGAVWSDLGNIWLFEEDPERPGSGLRLNKLLRDSYWTAGIGLRADLDFLVLRADYGAVLYLPIIENELRWIWNNNLPLYGLVFGIGYPF